MSLTLEELERELRKIKAKGYFINDLPNFYDGEVRRTGITKRYKQDTWKVGLSFPAKEVIRDDIKGLPLKKSHFKLLPLLLWIELDDEQYKIWEKMDSSKKGEPKND
jgi:hypothetical protein